MNVWRLTGALILVSAVVVGGFKVSAAQGEAGTLKWKAFETGAKPFYQKMETVTKQVMKVQSMEVVQDQSQTFVILWTPQAMKDGKWVVEQKIIAVKMNIKIGGNEIAFDSKDPNPPANPLTDFFKALVDSKFTLTIDPATLKVDDVTGIDEFVGKLATANDQLKPLLKSILSKDAIKQMSDPTFGAFPPDGKLVASGWKRAVDLNMGPIGSYNTVYEFTPESGNKIKVKATMTYKAPDKAAQGGLPFIITGGELTADPAKTAGVVEYDPSLGRIKSSDMTLVLKGKLKIDIGGMETEVQLDQNQTSKLITANEEKDVVWQWKAK
jgi:hypothetical protein